MGRPKLKNGKTRKINFMINPELGDFLKALAEKSNVSESDLHRHLFASALTIIIKTYIIKNDIPELNKDYLNLMLNTQVIPLLNPVLLVGEFHDVNKKHK
jgi:hypothetical protein